MKRTAVSIELLSTPAAYLLGVHAVEPVALAAFARKSVFGSELGIIAERTEAGIHDEESEPGYLIAGGLFAGQVLPRDACRRWPPSPVLPKFPVKKS